MRIQVGNDLVNIRQTGSTLWYPRREQAVIQKMDSLYERVAPNVLQWNADQPKVKNIDELTNPDIPALEPFMTPTERKKSEAKALDFPTEE